MLRGKKEEGEVKMKEEEGRREEGGCANIWRQLSQRARSGNEREESGK